MNARKLRLVLLGSLAAITVLFVCIMFFGLSQLKAKSTDMVNLKQQSKTLDDELSSLGQAKKQIEQYSYFKAVAQEVIPADKDQAETVYELFQLADQANIKIKSINFPNSTLGGSSGASSSATTSNQAGQSTSATAGSPIPISQATPVSGISGLYSTQLIVTSESGSAVPPDKQLSYDKLLQFLKLIENNRRTAQIVGVNIQPLSPGSQLLNATLTINIFVRPGS